MECPECHGAGMLDAIADPGCRLVRVSCTLCDGGGVVTAQRMEWRAAGKAYRTARVERMESLREAARRLGVHAADLSRFERGLSDPAKWTPDAPVEPRA